LTMWQRSFLRTRRELVIFANPEILDHSVKFTNLGGALGWKKRGDLDPTFEEAAFNLEASTTANPKYVEVKTGFGYHIIMVEGRK
jgi:hypothetical protein